jgi:hypothetical protein
MQARNPIDEGGKQGQSCAAKQGKCEPASPMLVERECTQCQEETANSGPSFDPAPHPQSILAPSPDSMEVFL